MDSSTGTGSGQHFANRVGDSRLAAPAMDVQAFRQLGYRAVDLAADHLAGLRVGPVFRPMPADARQAILQQPLPESGEQPDRILEWFQQHILPYPMGNGHPRFFGWVNSPPIPIGVIAELLATAMDPSCAGGDHAAIYLEQCTLRWLMELIGYPTGTSQGILVSGGSMASLTCLAAARQWVTASEGWDVRTEGLQTQRLPLMTYVSEEGHSCLRKSLDLLGLGGAAVRSIPVDDQYRMNVRALRSAVLEDRAAGRRPFCVAASAGTVNTGAVDPLQELADFCADQRLWLHVDGAYGAFGAMDPALAAHYAGMERADSLAIDPHKWLCVPLECGCALVRAGRWLREAFSLVPPYLRTEKDKGFGGQHWFSEYGFQQTRAFRALKTWMTLKHLGRSGIQQLVTRHIALARQFADQIARAPDFELLAPVELSIVCFRYVPRGLDDEVQLNALNKAIMEALQAGGEAFPSGTVLRGRFALRACVLHYATTGEDLAALLDAARRAGQEIQRLSLHGARPTDSVL